MPFEDLSVGQDGEAVDENGVWFPCHINEKAATYVVVSFPPWPEHFNRKIDDPSEIRPKTPLPAKRKPKSNPSLQVCSFPVGLAY